jgi:betaine lipid synthase
MLTGNRDSLDGYVKRDVVQVLPGGKVIWRSASNRPPYADFIAAAGFDVKRLQVATEGYMDRVNMYSSFYVATRVQN